MREAWEVRRASLHDRDALEELCRAAVGPDDYVIPLLDGMILRGVTYVAVDGDRIVGMEQYTPGIDGSAWLSAARTHPAYRRRGVAHALTEGLAGVARRSGVHALRLWSSASNVEGTASALASGFHEMGRFSWMRRTTAKGPSRATPIGFDADLVDEIRRSEPVQRGNGYIPYAGYFVAVTPANVHVLANAGALLRLAGGLVVVSTHPEDPEGTLGIVEIGLAAGDPAGVLAAVPAALAARGAKEVRTFLPCDREILDAARKAGFSSEPWGQEAVLYERAVEVGPTSYRKRRTFAEIAAGKREGYAALALLAGKHGHGHTGPHEDRWNP